MLIKVAIIDDKSSIRNILKTNCFRHGHFTITVMAEDGRDFREDEKPDEKQLPDVALMDPEKAREHGWCRRDRGRILFPSAKFVVLTIFDVRKDIPNDQGRRLQVPAERMKAPRT